MAGVSVSDRKGAGVEVTSGQHFHVWVYEPLHAKSPSRLVLNSWRFASRVTAHRHLKRRGLSGVVKQCLAPDLCRPPETEAHPISGQGE